MAGGTVDYRSKLHAIMVATLADEKAHKDWVYREVRPMPVPATWHAGQAVHGDCSKGVQYLCKWVNAPDPMQNNFGPYGNSQTLWSRLQHLDHPIDLKVGDIVTFGFDGNQHATMVMETGANPLLWSFGHQGAPDSYRLSDDTRQAQFLRNPVPVYVPTPQERLRAKTGWFSWVAWKLGEGDWKYYVKNDPRVRPNVPRLIPPSWWKRYALFLKNRNKGNPPTT
jgi:hypothetical protein